MSSPPHQPHHSPAPPPPPPPADSARSRPAQDAPHDQPMAKKLRRSSKNRSPNPNSSPSGSSSQGGLLESEMDADRSQQSEASISAAALPPKKKRTRTLTTPHQSAVLHALLAQSRFPTTAMREEVGRSIGLSARKVQIWFQNQRQKARRPSTQSGALLTRPTQYSSFSNPQQHHVSSAALSSLDHPFQSQSTEFDPGPSSRPYHRHPHPSTSPDDSSHHRYLLPDPRMDMSSQLLGPGMPGSDPHPHPPSSFRGRDLPPLPFQQQPPRPKPQPYGYPPQHHTSTYLTPRPASAQTSGPSSIDSSSRSRMHDQRTFSRTLPPLIFDVPRHRPSYSAPGPGPSTSPSNFYSPKVTPLGHSIAIPFNFMKYHSPGAESSPFAHQPPPPDQPTRLSFPQHSPPPPPPPPPPHSMTMMLPPHPRWHTSNVSTPPPHSWSRTTLAFPGSSPSYEPSSSSSSLPLSSEQRLSPWKRERERSTTPISARGEPEDGWMMATDPVPTAEAPLSASSSMSISSSATPTLPPAAATTMTTVTRTSRYDPVRAAFITYEPASLNPPSPSSTPISSASPSPAGPDLSPSTRIVRSAEDNGDEGKEQPLDHGDSDRDMSA